MRVTDRRATSRLITLCLGFACMLVLVGGLAVTGLAGPVQAAAADLPPRPTPVTPTSTPTPGPPEPAGAWIELRVHQPDSGSGFAWQVLWTAVQWQDLQGKWHDVGGWRGTPDGMADGAVRKVWWVAEKDLGTGPFRWVVHHGPGGEYLAASEAFTLPQAAGMTVGVELLLAR